MIHLLTDLKLKTMTYTCPNCHEPFESEGTPTVCPNCGYNANTDGTKGGFAIGETGDTGDSDAGGGE
jgi:hypothetical protein